MKLKALSTISLLTTGLFSLSPAHAFFDPPPRKAVQAAREGGIQGGGGGVEEMPFFEIRQDLERWIREGGSESLELPAGITHAQYASDMSAWLEPGVVAITLTSEPIFVAGKPKDCRSYIEAATERPQILCHRDLLKKSIEKQYQMLHHEFAALAGFERNIGAASDYFISVQITDSLEWVTVKRLVVKKRSKPMIGCSADIAAYYRTMKTWTGSYTYEKISPIKTSQSEWAQAIRILRSKGYEISEAPSPQLEHIRLEILLEDPDSDVKIESFPSILSYEETLAFIDQFYRKTKEYVLARRREMAMRFQVARTPYHSNVSVSGLLRYENTVLRTYPLHSTEPQLDVSPRLERKIKQAQNKLKSANTVADLNDARDRLNELLAKRTYTGASRDPIRNFIEQIPDCATILGKYRR